MNQLPKKLYAETFDGDVSKDRDTFIGGSDVGSIMGVNPYKSAYELFLEKSNQIERENLDDKLQIKLGHKMEQVVAELYEEETNEKVQLSNKSYKCKEYDFLVGHIDRKIVGKKKGLEIKTTSSYNKTDYVEGEIPPYHYYQCMFYMMITGMHDWDLATLRDNHSFYITHIEWNEEIAQDMLNKIVHFWNCVESKEWDGAIDGSESTSKALEKAYPAEKSKSDSIVPLSESGLPMALNEYENITDSIKELMELKTAFENTLKEAMGNAETAILNDKYVINWKSYTRSNGYDVKAFMAKHPKSDLKKFKKADSTYRRFSIKKIKKQQKEIKE